MQKEYNLVRVKELSKGVDSIVEVDWRNPEYVQLAHFNRKHTHYALSSAASSLCVCSININYNMYKEDISYVLVI